MRSIFLCIFLVISSLAHSQHYSVTVSAPQYDGGTSYLIYYYGKNLNIEDSAVVSPQGKIVFEEDIALKPGVYSIVLPGKRHLLDFLADGGQTYSISIPDTAQLLEKSVVAQSAENDIFKQYQVTAAGLGAKMQQEIEAFKSARSKADSVLHRETYTKYNDELNAYRQNIVQEHPESMLAALLKAMQDPKVLHENPKNRQDTLENYQHYKQHYWDGISLDDNRLIRTPFFLPRLEKYFREIVSPVPDSTIREAEHMLLYSRTSPEMFQFLLNWLTDEYINPKYMGQDKVFVHLFEKYHSKGVSNWLNEKQLTAISNRAYMVMSNLIGEKASDLNMTSAAGKSVRLYDLSAPYTVVAFWDPTCGHCRTEVPRMDSLYRNKWKEQGVKVFSVLTDTDQKTKWLEFIEEHKLNGWTNVYETPEQQKAVETANKPSYRQLYDVIQTPTLYLLDADKRIVAKKLSLEQIDEMIDAKVKADSTK